MTSISTERPGETPDSKPLRRDAEINRQRILAAAKELFSERGLTATLDDVAERAGVGVGTVYRRFADRDALVDALFKESIDELVAILEDALAIEDPWEGLVAYIRGHLEMQEKNRAFATVVMSDSYGRDRVMTAKEAVKPLVMQLFDRAHEAGVVRPDLVMTDIPILVLMLSSVVDATRDVAPDLWQRQAAFVLDGIRPGSATPLGADPLTLDQVPEVMRCGFNRR